MLGSATITCERGFTFVLERLTREKYFLPVGNIPPDEVGRHYLLPREAVEFDAEISREVTHKGSQKCLRAINVRLVHPRPPVDVQEYFEHGQVKTVCKGFCWLKRRDCFGEMFLSKHKVLSSSTSDFKVGQWYQYGVQPSVSRDGRDTFEAFDAEEIAAPE